MAQVPLVLRITGPSADGALAEERQMVDSRLEAEAFAHGVPQRLHEFVVEDEHRAALPTDEMVVPRVAEHFEAPGVAAEIGFAEQAEVAEQLQRSVDGRMGDGRQEGRDPLVDLVGRQMFPRREGAENHQPLGGEALARRAQPLGRVENIAARRVRLLRASIVRHGAPLGMGPSLPGAGPNAGGLTAFPIACSVPHGETATICRCNWSKMGLFKDTTEKGPGHATADDSGGPSDEPTKR